MKLEEVYSLTRTQSVPLKKHIARLPGKNGGIEIEKNMAIVYTIIENRKNIWLSINLDHPNWWKSLNQALSALSNNCK